jgi:ribosome biogenesis GTPase / thiamine phosphate phosphatase
MKGIIVKNISNDYTVISGGKRFVCKARGRFRYSNVVPMVGDRVVFSGEEGIILDILPRRNFLIRPSVSNIDVAFVMASVSPRLDLVLLDKMLTIISYNNIEPVICFTKMDLIVDARERDEYTGYMDYYRGIGYRVVCNDEIEEIGEIIKGKVVVFSGQSGSGKSTLVNRLDERLELKTNEISKALGRGKHTTRHNELYEVCGGYVVDTPGFSSIDFRGMDRSDIRDNFKEMYDYLDECKYRDCMHDKEDGCRVKELVRDGKILRSRYDNYIMFISI